MKQILIRSKVVATKYTEDKTIEIIREDLQSIDYSKPVMNAGEKGEVYYITKPISKTNLLYNSFRPIIKIAISNSGDSCMVAFYCYLHRFVRVFLWLIFLLAC